MTLINTVKDDMLSVQSYSSKMISSVVWVNTFYTYSLFSTNFSVFVANFPLQLNNTNSVRSLLGLTDATVEALD